MLSPPIATTVSIKFLNHLGSLLAIELALN
jgi:hypothetical protein